MLVGLEYAARRLPQGSLRTGLIAINKRYSRRNWRPQSTSASIFVCEPMQLKIVFLGCAVKLITGPLNH
jgi:hypothetical protein